MNYAPSMMAISRRGTRPSRLGDRASDAAFCPQVSLTPLSGCKSLPAPVKSMGLANSGTPIAIALIGLLLIGAGWLVYRRSRKAQSVTPEEEPADPPATARR